MQSELKFSRCFHEKFFSFSVFLSPSVVSTITSSSTSAAAERTLSLFHIITFYYEIFFSWTEQLQIRANSSLVFFILYFGFWGKVAWVKNISSQFKYLYCSCIKTWFIKRHDQPLWGRVFFICFGCTFVGFPLVNLLLSTFLLSLMIPFFMQISSLCLFPSLPLHVMWVPVAFHYVQFIWCVT